MKMASINQSCVIVCKILTPKKNDSTALIYNFYDYLADKDDLSIIK